MTNDGRHARQGWLQRTFGRTRAERMNLPSPGHPAPDGALPPDTIVPTERGHLGEWADVDVSDLGGFTDAIDRIYAGSLDGMTIRGVVAPNELATAIERVEQYRSEFKDYGKQVMYGTALVGADDDRQDYFSDAWRINDRIADLFDIDFVGRIADILQQVGNGREAVVPSEGHDRLYIPATVRFLPPESGVMHAHTANEFCNAWTSYDFLRAEARMWNSLSYFVVGEQPDRGGDLDLYDLMWDDTPADILELPMSAERDERLSRFAIRPISPGVGDMILFTGGRIWHRVSPVEGSKRRVTIGGFAATSHDDAKVYFWS